MIMEVLDSWCSNLFYDFGFWILFIGQWFNWSEHEIQPCDCPRKNLSCVPCSTTQFAYWRLQTVSISSIWSQRTITQQSTSLSDGVMNQEAIELILLKLKKGHPYLIHLMGQPTPSRTSQGQPINGGPSLHGLVHQQPSMKLGPNPTTFQGPNIPKWLGYLEFKSKSSAQY